MNWVAYLAEPGQWGRLPLDLMLLGILLFGAFTFGATEPWSQQLLGVFVLVAAVYTLLLGLARPLEFGRVGSWTYVPIVLFTGLVFLQTVPLPSGLVETIAPGTYETRQALLADLGGPGSSMTLSLMPAATSRLIWAFVPVITVFLIVLHAYRSESGVRRVCQIMVICAGAAVVQALFQNATGAGPRWTGRGDHPNSGPFLNYSHFGQYVNLGIGSAIGLVLFQLSCLFKKYKQPARVWSKLSKDKEHIGFWVVICVVVLGALAILLSMSRAGVISLLVAGGVIGLLLARSDPSQKGTGSVGVSGKDKSAVLLGIGLLVVCLLLAFGFDRVYDRAATLRNLETAQNGRVEILRDIAPAVASYPVFGTGFGTFEYVFPKYDSEVRGSLTTHAENEYAHLLFETGFAGILFILIFVTIVLLAGRRMVWGPVRSMDYIGFGLLFGFIAILIHSFSDFGQHVPAIAMMTALTTASILNLHALYCVRPASDRGDRPVPTAQATELSWAASQLGPGWLRFAGPVLIVAFMVLGAMSILALEGPRKAERAYAQGLSLEDRIYGSDPELIRLGDDERMIRRFAAAAELDPANPDYAYKRDYYDWGLLAYDAQGNEIDISSDPDQIELANEILVRIDASRRSAPTYGPFHLLAGEARFFGLNQGKIGAELIEKGHELTPHDPHAAYTAGLVKARQGSPEQARVFFEHALQLSPGLRRDIIDIYVEVLNDPSAAYQVAEGDVRALSHLQAILLDRDEQTALIRTIDRDLYAIVESKAYADHPHPNDLVAMAEYYRRDGKAAEAIKLYQRAIALAPRQVSWRLELGGIYVEQGNHEAAVREARAVLQLRPDSQRASALLQDQIVYLGSSDPNEPTN